MPRAHHLPKARSHTARYARARLTGRSPRIAWCTRLQPRQGRESKCHASASQLRARHKRARALA